jgi:ribonuclease HII
MPHLDLEISYGRNTGVLVAGVDEVGRGPLAGPVVAAAVIIPEGRRKPWMQGIKDSKKLQPAQRVEIAARIRDTCIYSVAEASVEEIDRLNILHAAFLAMQRAVQGLAHMPAHILVDGNHAPPKFGYTMPCAVTPLIKGDDISLSIAAASIIAKVHRDAYMAQLHEEFPHYGWNSNVGYSCAAHFDGLNAYGATPHHRVSFAPIRDILSQTKIAAS